MKRLLGRLLGMVGLGGPLGKLGAKIDRNTEGEGVSVNLTKTQITDAGLVHLKGLTKLKGLDLDDTRVTDAGLVHLKGMTELTWLGLSETQITDAGLAHLTELTSLQELGLGLTQVTDAGLVHLKGLTKLHRTGLKYPARVLCHRRLQEGVG